MNVIGIWKVSSIFLMLTALGLLALGVVAVHAQSGGGYDLKWNTVDDGGVTASSGGNYALGGTAGQADAAAWSGGGYTLAGGFWGVASLGGTAGRGKVYLPVIWRKY
jgi:hypothetical protein